jgi:hypothetical protein
VPEKIAIAIQRANQFGDQIEALVVAKGSTTHGDRNTLLMAYWSLAFELHAGILALMNHKFYAPAFALVRPIIETTVRAHISLCGKPADLKKLHNDTYRTNLSTVGKEIDKAFQLGTFFQDFLDRARHALHSFTHAGLSQLGRRFKGTDLVANFREQEIIEVINASTSCVFMVNSLVTKHFGFEEEWKKNSDLYAEWGKH